MAVPGVCADFCEVLVAFRSNNYAPINSTYAGFP